MEFEVKLVEDKKTARRVGEFLISSDAFEQTWAPKEKGIVLQAPTGSLNKEKHRFWYVEDANLIVAAMGIRENKYGSGGYEMDEDYFAVHKDFRRKGIATLLLKKVEEFVKEKKGRYIHILTCDIDSYKPAISFYEKNGYRKVAAIPNYYVKGEGRLDYFKEIVF